MIWRQRQKAGNNSSLIQAGVANFGLGYDDVLAVAENCVNGALSSYSQAAFREAEARVQEITLNFLAELSERNPDALKNAQDPGIQAAIIEAQSGYAKSGDQDLGEILVSLLVERIGSVDRNIQQLALNESISAAQKLTGSHLRLLTATFLICSVRHTKLPNYQTLHARMKQYYEPFIDGLKFTESDVSYLEAAGCLRISSVGSRIIPDSLRKTYPGLFTKGIDPDLNISIKPYLDSGLTISCIRDSSLVQINAVDEESLSESTGSLPADEQEVLRNLLQANLMSDDEITEEILSNTPSFDGFLASWNATSIQRATPTLVGTAIAHANLQRILGAEFDASIDIWIS
ncbi:LPO_1073/Vpar_1526 family protein [Kitasatospora sp. NPDC002040]|uniref:LPO_1073/Vpar_1526 family protein n=1 Tax=Kitasatospora sp. NPDC002040 TaxID=3154661 RepID=UPI0033207BA4